MRHEIGPRNGVENGFKFGFIDLSKNGPQFRPKKRGIKSLSPDSGCHFVRSRFRVKKKPKNGTLKFLVNLKKNSASLRMFPMGFVG